jgi:hypothetical protein
LAKDAASHGPASTAAVPHGPASTAAVPHRYAEGPRRAVAELFGGMRVVGAPSEVRATMAIVDGNSRVVTPTSKLFDALGRAPTAKVGRPAVMMGLVVSPRFEEELVRLGLPLRGVDWLALSFAVDGGFDLGGTLACPNPEEALGLVRRAAQRIEAFRESPELRLVGLASLFDPLVLRPRGSEVSVAYRVEARLLSRLLRRLDEGRRLLQRPDAPAPADKGTP